MRRMSLGVTLLLVVARRDESCTVHLYVIPHFMHHSPSLIFRTRNILSDIEVERYIIQEILLWETLGTAVL